MISRALVTALSFIIAVVQASRGAWVESAGLVGLGTGLLMLRAWGADPRRRWVAWVPFSVTAIAMATVAMRMRH